MKKIKHVFIGFLVALTLLPTLLVFAKNIDVELNSVRIEKNGVSQAEIGESYTLPNGEQTPFSILYNGTTYLPVRKLSEILSVGIGWDNDTRTVSITAEQKPSATTVENAYEEYPQLPDFGKFASVPCALTTYTLRSTIYWYPKEVFTKETLDSYCIKLLYSGFEDKSPKYSGYLRYYEKGDIGVTVSGCPDSHLMDFIVVSNLRRPYSEKTLFYDEEKKIPSFEGFCKLRETKTTTTTGAIYRYTDMVDVWSYFMDYVSCLKASGFEMTKKTAGFLGAEYIFKSGKTSISITAESVSGTGDTLQIQIY